jgi:Carbohydrate esterase, sialic acid-specific acetylesterase
MPTALLQIGQSNAEALIKSNSDSTTGIAADWQTWNGGATSFGTAFRDAQWGLFPLDRQYQGRWTNNMAQGMADEQPGLRSVHVCNGGHPLEAFITKATRVANGWPEVIEAPLVNMAPFIFDATNGARRALTALGKASFDLIVLHQGENRTAQWAQKLAALHGDLTAAGLAGPATVFLCGGLYDGGGNYAAHKADGLAVLPTLPNAAYVDSAGLLALSDGLHFTGKALVNLGRRLIRQYQAMV